MTVLGKMENIYVNTKICIPESLNACENSEKLWNFTYLKLPDNSYEQLIFDGNHHYTEPASKSVTIELKCFSGESAQQRIFSRDFSIVSENTAKCKDSKIKEEIFYWIWEVWRLSVGPKIREIYPSAISILNLGAQNNEYKDIGNVWREEIELTNLREKSNELLNDILPFYNMLHTFVRFILSKKYKIDFNDGLIPAHLIGTTSWESIFHDEIAPYLFGNDFDLDKALTDKKWSAIDLIKRSEDFYGSLGLPPMTRKFWTNSYISDKDAGNETICHGTAANMFDKDDFRMITCASKSFYDFYVILHEMGHIQYYMLSDQQPAIFQDGNTLIQESVGDSMYLGVMTASHLNRLRLIPDRNIYRSKFSANFDLYLLMKLAFSKIPLIPFQHLFDQYRWDLFSGKVKFEDSNDHYWNLVEKYQKIKPPNGKFDRHNLFDIGAYFHLGDNTPYMPYFLASFVQTQIFKSMCEMTVYNRLNYEKELPMDLHKCDIYGSKKAGKLLKSALDKGSSVPLKGILKILTGSQEISSKPLLEFYRPLTNFLEKFFNENNIKY